MKYRGMQYFKSSSFCQRSAQILEIFIRCYVNQIQFLPKIIKAI